MAGWKRIAPIFGVQDLEASLAFYQRLGFTTRPYPQGYGYGFATRDEIEIHLGVVPPATAGAASAYLFVEDSESLAEEWRLAGVDVDGPEDTDWNKHEGAVVDPDGNVIRFGSPIRS